MVYVLVCGKQHMGNTLTEQYEDLIDTSNSDDAIQKATATIRALSRHDRNELYFADLYEVTERDYERVQKSRKDDAVAFFYDDCATCNSWDIMSVADMMDAGDDEEFRVRPAFRNNWTDECDWDGYVTKEDVIDLAYDWGVDASILFTQLMRI